MAAPATLTSRRAAPRAENVLLPVRAGRLTAGDVVIALCEPGREHVLHDVLVGVTPQ